MAQEVSRLGGLPFVATAGLSGSESRRLMEETRNRLGKRPFGAGIVRFADPERNEEMLSALRDAAPDFVIIAGGNHELARRLEQEGIRVYLHAPSAAHVQQFLKMGVRNLILEGHEAGGHVGAIPSLILWELGASVLEQDHAEDPVHLLLAGGIATSLGAVLAAATVGALEERGVRLAMQLGTAYLLTEEAVESGSIPQSYLQTLCSSQDTILSGRTVNLPSRWIADPAVEDFVREENKLLISGVPLPDRKRIIEKQVLSKARLALSGRGPDADEAAEAVLDQGFVGSGQVISAVQNARTVSALHHDLTDGAASLAKKITAAATPEAGVGESVRVVRNRVDRDDAVAVVGMGCIFPDAGNPAQFWQNILSRRYSIKEVPRERWDSDTYYAPKPCPSNKTYSKLGAFVEGFQKNPIKFRIPPIAAPSIDRSQFMALEAAHQALEDANYLERDYPRERAGVFIGNASGGELRENYGLTIYWDRFIASLQSTEFFHRLS
jgi:NAD(P)H-dependent flavin oxidoreductase YrpB (nitropropane dioxygenase family)